MDFCAKCCIVLCMCLYRQIIQAVVGYKNEKDSSYPQEIDNRVIKWQWGVLHLFCCLYLQGYCLSSGPSLFATCITVS